MIAAPLYKSNCIILVPFFIFAYYALNVDSLIQSVWHGIAFYQIFPLIIASSIPLIFPNDNRKFQKNSRTSPMILWISALIFLSLLRIMIGFDAEYAMIGLRCLLSTLIMIATWVVGMRYVTAQANSTSAKLILLAIFAAACGSVVLDPFIDIRARIDPSMIGTYDPSRAGGVFLQPNQASASLALLYAAVLPRVGPKTAIACTAAVLLGIFLTFSRSGQIMIALIIAISLMRGYLPRAAVGLLVGTAALFLAGSYFQNQIVDTFGIDQGSGFLRLTDTSRFYGVDAFASDSRAYLAEKALADFTAAPWVGQGLGFSWKWGDMQFAGAGTHNLYLRYMLEYGALGALIWPLFLLAVFQIRNRTLDTAWSIGLCICGAVAALFSHNIPEQGSILVVMAAILTLPVLERSVTESRIA